MNRARRRIAANVAFVAILLACFLRGATAFGAVDISGSWMQLAYEDRMERTQGAELGDFLGLPINDAAIARAESWDAAELSLPEHQCEPHPADYAPHGPAALRISSDLDPNTKKVVAWRVVFAYMNSEQVIWMDGRPHPSERDLHTWMGFSTGRWQGNILITRTSHLKEGWLRRNGIPRSDEATLTEYWMRHGNYLTVVSIVQDPVYLSAPLIRSWNWVLSLGYQLTPFVCDSVAPTDLPRGYVAHHLPGTNLVSRRFAAQHALPLDAVVGGVRTTLPEYEDRIKEYRAQSPSARSSVMTSHPQSYGNTERETASVRTDAGQIQGMSFVAARTNVYVLSDGGSNITVHVSDSGIVVIDTGALGSAEAALSAIHGLSQRPIRYIINTSSDLDHIGGNAKFAAAGQFANTFTGTTSVYVDISTAPIYAHENALKRMSAMSRIDAHVPEAAWPTETFSRGPMELAVSGESIQIMHEPSAHTDADSVVYFRHADLISAGDVFRTDGYPGIEVAKGGSIDGVIAALNDIIDVAIPGINDEGGTLIVPGHGRLCDESDVVRYRDMVTIVRDRIRSMIKRGMTLQEILTARPTRDYDGRYASSGNQTEFVTAVYKSIKQVQ